MIYMYIEYDIYETERRRVRLRLRSKDNIWCLEKDYMTLAQDGNTRSNHKETTSSVEGRIPANDDSDVFAFGWCKEWNIP